MEMVDEARGGGGRGLSMGKWKEGVKVSLILLVTKKHAPHTAGFHPQLKSPVVSVVGPSPKPP